MLLSNPNFDDDLQLASWSPMDSQPTWESLDVDGWPTSGSAHFVNTFRAANQGAGIESECIPAVGGATYSLSGWGYSVPPAPQGRLILELAWYRDSSCAPSGALPETTMMARLVSSQWVEAGGSATAPDEARAVLVRAMNAKDFRSRNALETHVDALLLAPEPGGSAVTAAAVLGVAAMRRWRA
jgi:hypothetical protein